MEEKKENIINEELILKYLQRTISDAEAEELLAWVNISADNKKIFLDYKDLWYFSAQNKINGQFDKNKARKAFSNYSTQKKTAEKSPVRLVSFIAAVAASLVLMLFAYNSFLKPELITIANTQTEIESFWLPDSSQVIWYPGSEMSYYSNYNKKNRQLSFTGKAYFKVKNSQLPFIVEFNEYQVIVTGTEFSIETSDNNDNAIVAVEKGSVLVASLENGVVEEALHPGEILIIDKKTNKVVKENNHNKNLHWWVNRKVEFKDEALKNVFMFISEQFNVKFVPENKQLFECNFTGKLSVKKLTPLLTTLEVAFGIEIDKEPDGNTYFVKGTGCK